MGRRMKSLFVLSATLLLAVCALAKDSPEGVEPGKRVFERERCATCHSIAGKGNRRNPLDGAGSRLSSEQIEKWIVSPQEMKPGVKKKGFKLSSTDLEALVRFLQSLTD